MTWMYFVPLRRLLTDHNQRGCENTVERHTPLPHTCTQPGCAVHDIWGYEEEGGQRREEGEQTQEIPLSPSKLLLLIRSTCDSLTVKEAYCHGPIDFWLFISLCVLFQISSVEIFVIGAVAKAIATTATYPLQTIQAILRVWKLRFIYDQFVSYVNRSSHFFLLSVWSVQRRRQERNNWQHF